MIDSTLFVSLNTLCDWLKKLAPLSRPIRSKTKTNQALIVFASISDCVMVLLASVVIR